MDPSIDLSHTPLAPNPSGAPPNFVNPPSLDGVILGIGVALVIVSTVILVLRFYANFQRPGKLGLDDGLCFFAWITASVCWLLTYTFVRNGSARHAWDVPLSILNNDYMKKQFAATLIGTFAAWAAKACILSLYIRIFSSLRWIRITCYTILVLTACYYLSSVGVWIAFCVPRRGTTWATTELTEASESKLAKITIVILGILSVLLDIVLLALPFPVIARLQLDQKKKIRLMLVFSVALCTLAASCASLVFRIQYVRGATIDLTWVSMKIIIASTAEQFGAVIVSCAPALSSFFNIVSKSKFYSNLKSNISSKRHPSHASTWPRNLHSEPNMAKAPMYDDKSLLGDTFSIGETVVADARSLRSVHSHADEESACDCSVMNITISTHIEVRSDPK